MAVMLETSKGELVIDLYTEDCPNACKNFLKLCKLKYYNNCLFHSVQRHFIAQTGDPTGTGKGGESVYGIMYGDQARFFEGEIRPHLRHTKMGLVGMAAAGKDLNASQFYITLATDLSSLDEKMTIFGEVAEGLGLLEQLNEVLVDDDNRPLQNIRIRHTTILDDPFEDPPALEEHIPEASPEPQFEQGGRLEEDWVPEDEDARDPEEVEKSSRAHEAKSRAVVLEMIGDLPEADVKPPSNMLFVCKLNPVTTEEDLEIIFSRYGKVTTCDIIRDFKTGDSLCYAFIGFDSDEACEAAYFKMNNVLIDDRRIRVDFSQSVHNIWKQFRVHGAKGGNAALAKDAAQHERGAGAGLELKQQFKQYGGGGGGGGRGGPPGGNQGLLFDAPGRQPAPQRQHEPSRQGLGSSRAREERAYPEPQPQPQQQQRRRHSRSRSRSRDGRKKRQRSSSRERKHDSKHGHKGGKYEYSQERERSRGPHDGQEVRYPATGDGRHSSRREQDDRYISSKGHDSSRRQMEEKHRDYREQEHQQREDPKHAAAGADLRHRGRGEEYDRGGGSRSREGGRVDGHHGSSRRSGERSRERSRHRSRSRDRGHGREHG